MKKLLTLDHCSAVITGASSGLGIEFAKQLAAKARSICLIARRLPELEETRRTVLSINPALSVTLCAADVSTQEGRASVLACIAGLTDKPNLLINNAGIGDYGHFESADPTRLAQQVDVNITAVLLLTHAALPLMTRPAGVLNVSSLAGTIAMPGLAVYAASKAFVTSFSEALRLELAAQGVAVCAVCPGPTPTNFGKNSRRASGEDTNRSGQGVLRQPPENVVRDGLAALLAGRAVVYPGLPVALAAWIFRILPRPIVRWAMARRLGKETNTV